MTGRRDAVETVEGLAELLSAQAGLARRSQLRRLGVTAAHIADHVAALRWRQVAPEVISADNGRLDAEQLRWRAVLHAPMGWLGGRSALEHLGLRGHPPELVHILVPMGNRPRPLPGVRIHVTTRTPEQDTPAPGSLRTCPAPRACVDAAAWERHPRAAAGVVLAVVQQRLAGPD